MPSLADFKTFTRSRSPYTLGEAGLYIKRVQRGSKEFSHISEMRRSGIGWNPAAEHNFAQLESFRDRLSQHLAFYLHGDLIGGVRMTPMGSGVTLTEKLFDVHQHCPDPTRVCDINRLVLVPEYRRGRELIPFIKLVIEWGQRVGGFKSATALSSQRLLPLYRYLGCRIVVPDIEWLAGEVVKHYSVVCFHTEGNAPRPGGVR